MASARGCFNCGGCAFCRCHLAPLPTPSPSPSFHLLPSIERLPHKHDSCVDLLAILSILPPRSYIPNVRRGRADESCLPLLVPIFLPCRGGARCSRSIPRFALQNTMLVVPSASPS